jgi:hypothetical protein
VEDAAAHLFKNTGAAVVAVFKVNPVFGTRVLYRAYTRDGRDKTHEGLDVGLFTGNASNNADVVALMAGRDSVRSLQDGAERDWPVVYRSRHGLRVPYQRPARAREVYWSDNRGVERRAHRS